MQPVAQHLEDQDVLEILALLLGLVVGEVICAVPEIVVSAVVLPLKVEYAGGKRCGRGRDAGRRVPIVPVAAVAAKIGIDLDVVVLWRALLISHAGGLRG